MSDCFPVSTALFTNLTQDHLDFHKNFEDYYQSKKLLFSKHLKSKGVAIINGDDNYGNRLSNELAQLNPKILEIKKQIHWKVIHSSFDGSQFELLMENNHWDTFETQLFGEHNISNLCFTIKALEADQLNSKQFSIKDIQDWTKQAQPAKGRLELVFKQPYIFIDYAHTPDALEKTLRSIQALKKREQKIWIVFGCGGDRDSSKRASMGNISKNLL